MPFPNQKARYPWPKPLRPCDDRYRKARRFNLRDAGTFLGLVLIFAVFAVLNPVFLTAPNLINILQQSSINACIALGMTFVIISGGIDLSVGPTAAVSAIVGATLMIAGVPIPLAVAGAIATGMACGLFNGALVEIAGLQPFIVTLGALSLYRALALIFTGGNPIFGIPTEFRSAINGLVMGVPVPVIIVAIIVYVLSGGMAVVAALILTGRLGAADPTMGNLWELDAIAAAAIGGASLTGGKGSVVGTLMGAVILGGLRNGLTLMNVQAFYQLLATGIIILVAMLIDRATRGRA